MNKKNILWIKDTIEEFIQREPKGLVIFRWATATGKTSLSCVIAKKIDAEIISADSRQIYRHMDIGTDKISDSVRSDIRHHMIDIVSPDETYTAWQRKEQVEWLIADIHERWKVPIVAGWTWLYIDMLYKNFNMPEVAPDQVRRTEMEKKESDDPWFLFRELEKVDPNEAMKHHPNSIRYVLRALEIYTKTGIPKSELAKELPVKRPLLMIWLWREKEDTNGRINKRIKQMLKDWALIEENKNLLQMWYTLDHTAMNGIWYKEVVWYINGEYDIDRCEELMKRNTHRYAKRQRSRFRRYIMDSKARPKDNVQYELIELESDDAKNAS